jgi:hypothetical protein
MPKHSWIRHLLHSLKTKPQFKSRRRRSRQTIETLEARMLLTTPTVVSINLVGAATTNATTTSWTATFSESVKGVDPTNFELIETGDDRRDIGSGDAGQRFGLHSDGHRNHW